MSYVRHGPNREFKMKSAMSETKCCLPLDTAGRDAFKWPMVEVIIPLMPDGVLEGSDFEGFAFFMSTPVRIISIVFYKCRIA